MLVDAADTRTFQKEEIAVIVGHHGPRVVHGGGSCRSAFASVIALSGPGNRRDCLRLVINLADAAVLIVGNEDVAGSVHRHSAGKAEPACHDFQPRPPSEQLVLPVYDQRISLVVSRHGFWKIQRLGGMITFWWQKR